MFRLETRVNCGPDGIDQRKLLMDKDLCDARTMAGPTHASRKCLKALISARRVLHNYWAFGERIPVAPGIHATRAKPARI